MSGFFDTTITIGHYHMAAAGLDPGQPAEIVEAVRRAVRMMDGANWIDVEAADFPPACRGWVTVYPRGCSLTPDSLRWRERQRQVEEAVKTALIAAATPF